MGDKLWIVILCMGNACRSQMAEGWVRQRKGEVIDPYSAGIDPGGLAPCAVAPMAEAGVDISHHRSRHVNELLRVDFD